MNRNVLYVIIAILVLALIALGWNYYQDRNSSRLEINLGGNGISVEAD